MSDEQVEARGSGLPISHRVLRAVVSQDGERFVRYGNAEHAGWISLLDLHRHPAEVLCTLSQSNVHLLTNKSREGFKKAIEAQTEFKPVLVARHPGWISDGAYVLGDGRMICRKRNYDHEVIVAMSPNIRFEARGTLDGWKAANAPFLEDQPLVRIVYAYALSGFLIHFAPLDFQNPILEIIGETGMGKTSLAVAAGSICGGALHNPNGFCLSWDRTNATFDRLQRQHRDCLLTLNENNLTGSDAAAQAEFMRTAVMKFTEPGERDTMISTEAPIYPRLALLSTSNRSIAELIGGKTGSDAAVRSRVLTLRADRPFGVFDLIPAGFNDAGDAARGMVQAASESYGVCSRAFIAFLNRYDSDAVTRCIEHHYRRLKSRKILAGSWDERQLKTLALCRAADHLAKQAGALPIIASTFDEALHVLASGDRSRRQGSARHEKR